MAVNIEYIWKGKKCYFGLPISFTRYAVSEDRLFLSTGFFTIRDEEILLYRIRDINTSRTLWQRIFGVGTITVTSSDKSRPVLLIESVKMPAEVKELIHQQVEENKIRRRVRYGEIASFADDMDDQLDGED